MIIIKRHHQRGLVTVGLALTLAVVVFLMANAVQVNMQIFLTSFNRNKAFYDAELVIERLGVEIKNAYELGQKVAPNLTDPYPLQQKDNADPDPLHDFQSYLIRLGHLYLQEARLCVERSDNRLIASPICVEFDANQVILETISWRDRLRAYQLALDQTIRELSPLAEVEAQNLEVNRPTLPAVVPTIVKAYDLTEPDLTQNYTNFHCQNPRAAGSKVKQCITFRFCTKFSGVCNEQELIYQTLILSELPKTDVED